MSALPIIPSRIRERELGLDRRETGQFYLTDEGRRNGSCRDATICRIMANASKSESVPERGDFARTS
ncbi:hypothetical protein N7530_012863 [Penicillium desertorum]|uniref:Uncharacterized protein n=1 Tax=Penicillium desertorum TaxID=1303715 RepID=A0A9X0BFM8_9EURO|nr:hypothetical protein N7530_012863 [Penicillium desertorum]